MTLYLITYDLNKPGQHYKSLYDNLNSFSDILHPMESIWLVSTDKSAKQIYDHITAGLTFDGNDKLLITKISNPKYGRLIKSEWDWINARL